MTDQQFIKLLTGPLHHPLIMFQLSRLAIALRAVVEATGEAGERALLEHCQQREEKDHRDD